MNSIKLPAEIGNLRTFVSFVADCARMHGFRQERVLDLELAAEEAVTNVCLHAHYQKTGELEIRCFKEPYSDRLVVEIRDSGKAFDVLSAPPPDFTSDLEDRKIGGLGVFLIRKMVDEVHYSRKADENVLRLIFGPLLRQGMDH